MYPIIENLKKDGYEIKQYIIDNDEDLLVAQSYGISAVPTMIINEKIYLVGYRPESEIRKNLKV
jgi:predicted DsbA family dithiol-disulfide isomerase